MLFKGKKAKSQEGSTFSVRPQEGNIDFPPIKEKKTIDVRYPLIEPYAYAHIYWDAPNNELVYSVEEPILNPEEKKMLEMIEKGIEELINISFISVNDEKTVIEYLEKNLQVLISELKLKVHDDSIDKFMYYIYRDFIGLNEIEPLLKDFYIEDVECNGFNTPIYLVHRKYRNLRTNISYDNLEKLTNFVEKLAQKSGKYISYATPLLDGRLPDGTRVNATYTQDISSRGPTFTLRKFTKEPWSPVRLIQFRTVSPEILAYLWLLIENGSNIMIIGGTGEGKTSLLNSIAFFIPPQARIVSIEDSVTGDSKIIIKQKDLIRNISIKEFVDKKIDAEVMTLDYNGKIIFVKPSKYIKHKVKKQIYEVLTATGRRVKVTQDHSLFTLKDRGLAEVKPIELKEGESFIAVPRLLPITGKEIKEINLMDHLETFDEDFLAGTAVKKIFEKYTYKDLSAKKMRYIWWKRHNIIKIKEFRKLQIDFSREELKTLRIKSKNRASIPVIFDITRSFLEFCGLWLGDGSYDNHNKNSVILSNFDNECRQTLYSLSSYLNSNFSEMNDKGCSLRIHNSVFYKFMKYVIKLDGYSDTKQIPEFIFSLSNEQVKSFIRGYFSADGTVKKDEVSCSSQSLVLLEDLQSMLLRFGIISRIGSFNRKDRCMALNISSHSQIGLFKEIGFLQNRQNIKLNRLNRKSHHTCSDIIPLSVNKLEELNDLSGQILSWPYLHGMQNIGREYVQRIAPKGSEFNDLSHNDLFWDKVKKIRKLRLKETEVFDLSIPKYEKFLCNNIFVHNTRELNLVHENWLPSVVREGIGIKGEEGEVDMFTLLKESFRQRPDYVIVGEIRGKEAYVLFQGAASGHSTMSTMHAEDVATMIRRLETKPIELSPSLVNTIDAVCVIGSIKSGDKHERRVKEIAEIEEVGERLGQVKLNYPFTWDPKTDSFFFKTESRILDRIEKKAGISRDVLNKEFNTRARLLMKLYQNNIFDFKKVQDVINAYYKDKEGVLRKYNLL